MIDKLGQPIIDGDRIICSYKGKLHVTSARNYDNYKEPINNQLAVYYVCVYVPGVEDLTILYAHDVIVISDIVRAKPELFI